jgi:HK97 family phage portal protein
MQITKAWRAMLAKARAWSYSFRLDGTGYRGHRGNTDTGIYITRDVALQSSTVAACVNLIGTTIAHLGFDVMATRKGSNVIITDHPLHQLIKFEPNRQQTSDEFWQRLFWDQELDGNAYARIERLRSAGVISLKAWCPESVDIDTRTKPEWTYKYQYDLERESVPERGSDGLHNILHLRNVTRDGVCGVSTVALARQRIGLDLAVEKYGAAFFGKGGRVKDIFEYDKVLSPEQRASFKALFRENYGNIDSFHEAMLMEAGVKYGGKSGSTPNEAQFLETQTSTAIAICRFFGVPPTLVGILDRATYNNQEQLMLQFLTLCLTPRISRAEKALRRALLTTEEKNRGMYIHCNVNKLLRADMRTRAEYYKVMQSLGDLNQNDVRALEDMPRIDDPSADVYRQAANLFGQPADPAQAGADAGTEAAQNEIRRAAA